MSDSKKHHPYGPSRWSGLAVCSGYEPRRDGDKEFAERGTAVHLALDTGDYSKLREEDAGTARWMANEIAAMTQGLEGVESEVATEIPEDERLPEILWGITGTCDRTWVTEDGTRHIADFKAFSKIGVTDHTPQCVGYALGLPEPANGLYMFHILHGGSERVETAEFSQEDIAAVASKVACAIENPAAALARSHHCDNCAKAGNCPESAKVVAFGALAAGRLTREAVKANPAEAARLCDWLDAASKRIEDAREIIATACKEDGVNIEDPATGIRYGVQIREGKAKIPPLSEIEDRLVDEDGVSVQAILERATIGLTALRELVGKKRAEEYAVRGEDIKCFVRKGGAKMLK